MGEKTDTDRQRTRDSENLDEDLEETEPTTAARVTVIDDDASEGEDNILGPADDDAATLAEQQAIADQHVEAQALAQQQAIAGTAAEALRLAQEIEQGGPPDALAAAAATRAAGQAERKVLAKTGYVHWGTPIRARGVFDKALQLTPAGKLAVAAGSVLAAGRFNVTEKGFVLFTFFY